jgi:hydrogenase-4 transcriptional activator
MCASSAMRSNALLRAENGALITPEHLSPELRQMGVPTAPPESISSLGKTISGRAEIATQNLTLAEALEEVERRMIIEALRKHRGNISRAARELGLTRRGLYLKLDRYQISTESRADGATVSF